MFPWWTAARNVSPRIVGLGRALELILTGRPVTAAEALSMGLANEVAPAGQALSRAIELAHLLAAFPQAALRNDRRAVYEGLGQPLEEGLKIEARLGEQTMESGEATDGAREFQRGKGRGGDWR